MVRRAGDREKMVSGWGGISTGGDGQLVQTNVTRQMPGSRGSCYDTSENPANA